MREYHICLCVNVNTRIASCILFMIFYVIFEMYLHLRRRFHSHRKYEWHFIHAHFLLTLSLSLSFSMFPLKCGKKDREKNGDGKRRNFRQIRFRSIDASSHTHNSYRFERHQLIWLNAPFSQTIPPKKNCYRIRDSAVWIVQNSMHLTDSQYTRSNPLFTRMQNCVSDSSQPTLRMLDPNPNVRASRVEASTRVPFKSQR